MVSNILNKKITGHFGSYIYKKALARNGEGFLVSWVVFDALKQQLLTSHIKSEAKPDKVVGIGTGSGFGFLAAVGIVKVEP